MAYIIRPIIIERHGTVDHSHQPDTSGAITPDSDSGTLANVGGVIVDLSSQAYADWYNAHYGSAADWIDTGNTGN